MSNCLVLLTNYYPYYKGEEYLESEIGYLSDKFKTIYVIPTMVNNNMKKTRQVPMNVTVINIDYSHTMANRLKNIFKIGKSNIKKDSKNISHILYQNYFNNRCFEIMGLIKRKLDLLDFAEYDGIVIYSYWLYVTAQVGILLKTDLSNKINKSISLISRAHRYDLYEEESKLKFLPSRNYILENIDYVYPCSDDGANFLKTKYPKYIEKVETKRLGSEYQGINKGSEDGIFRIVSCSALRPIKRVDLIIDSLKELETKNIKFHWTHFGDGEEFENLLQKARCDLNEANFTFEGFVKNEDLLKYYEMNSVDCFINVSKSEGIPVSIMEAMSFTIPVIATDVGGTREIVLNNFNGILLDANVEAHDIFKAIEKIALLELSEIKSIRKNSFEVWKKNYDSSILYNNFSNELIEMQGV
ncbi:glycosyltransferase [Vagococcus fluvialis]|uniref:glycosyltransferase n=1 Tax=Vagococcus fluvialis TaxID=2738 RepID=UPI001A8DCD5D|nr:glycosyltransferase [Vagococcus fluvialis]MBO0479510.1 glycosyltransferase [Vagococcus fluvialis]MBO0484852.1 glycosyltransferase [Vagococcus fluvialis]